MRWSCLYHTQPELARLDFVGQVPELPVALVAEALVILLDELLVTGGVFFLDGVENRITLLVAKVAPGARRSAAVQALDGVAIDSLAAAAGGSLLSLAFTLGLAFPFATLAGLGTGLRLAATLAIAFLLFRFLDQFGEDIDDLFLLVLGGV